MFNSKELKHFFVMDTSGKNRPSWGHDNVEMSGYEFFKFSPDLGAWTLRNTARPTNTTNILALPYEIRKEIVKNAAESIYVMRMSRQLWQKDFIAKSVYDIFYKSLSLHLAPIFTLVHVPLTITAREHLKKFSYTSDRDAMHFCSQFSASIQKCDNLTQMEQGMKLCTEIFTDRMNQRYPVVTNDLFLDTVADQITYKKNIHDNLKTVNKIFKQLHDAIKAYANQKSELPVQMQKVKENKYSKSQKRSS